MIIQTTPTLIRLLNEKNPMQNHSLKSKSKIARYSDHLLQSVGHVSQAQQKELTSCQIRNSSNNMDWNVMSIARYLN